MAYRKKYILRLLSILKRHFLARQRVNNIQRKGFCSKHSFQCSPCWTTVSHHFHADNMSKNFVSCWKKNGKQEFVLCAICAE